MMSYDLIPLMVSCSSLGLMSFGMITALCRTLPYAQRLGKGGDNSDIQSKLAIQVFYDHATAFTAMICAVGIQLYTYLLLFKFNYY